MSASRLMSVRLVNWRGLEDDDAEVLVKPCLLVREAASVLFGQSGLDGLLDPQASRREGVQQVCNSVGVMGQRDLRVAATWVGVKPSGEVLLSQQRPVLLRPFDGRAIGWDRTTMMNPSALSRSRATRGVRAWSAA